MSELQIFNTFSVTSTLAISKILDLRKICSDLKLHLKVVVRCGAAGGCKDNSCYKLFPQCAHSLFDF